MLRLRGHDVRLRAIGPFETPEYQHEVLALVDQHGIADAIDWTGFVSDIHAELRQVDLFVLPSLFGEGLPMVVLEAMAAGLPVVASEVEGIPAAIRDGVDGLLVEPGNPEALAKAISEVIKPQSPCDYLAMCREARARHTEKFSAAAMAAGVRGCIARYWVKRSETRAERRSRFPLASRHFTLDSLQLCGGWLSRLWRSGQFFHHSGPAQGCPRRAEQRSKQGIERTIHVRLLVEHVHRAIAAVGHVYLNCRGHHRLANEHHIDVVIVGGVFLSRG